MSVNSGKEISLGVGIGVGGLVCSVAAAAIIVFVALPRHQRDYLSNTKDSAASSPAHSNVFPKAELDAGHQEIFEISGTRFAAELP